MDDLDHFRQTVSSSPALTQRWTEISDAAIAHAAKHGIVMTRHDCLQIDRLRLATSSGDDELAHGWQEEAEAKIDAWKQRAESRKFMDALNSANETEAAKARADVMARSPQERMRIAREGGETLAKPATTKKDLTPEERAKIIAQLDAAGIKGSERIRRAREAGLE